MAQDIAARITDLIRADHTWFRDRFSVLDTGTVGGPDLASQWRALADRLEVHAAAEEKHFYPHLLADDSDAADETKDAIKDHNEIRDAIRRAAQCEVGSSDWWEAVHAAESANADHMKEEEEGPLPDFERDASPVEQQELARLFASFEADHPPGRGVSGADKDPARYVETHGEE